VPLDLVAHTFSFVSSERFLLKQCALVCRAWTPFAQRLLYSEFRLTSESRYSWLILDEAPHLLGYIQRLHLWIRYGTPELGVPARLLPVVRAMDHVTSIEIRDSCYSGYTCMSSLVSRMKEQLPFAQFVQNVTWDCALPDVILACFAAFPSLQALELSRISRQNQDLVLDATNGSQVVLKELIFDINPGVDDCLRALLFYPRTVDHLRVVDIRMDIRTGCQTTHDWRRVNSLLALCGWTLERLHVRCDVEDHAPDTHEKEAHRTFSGLGPGCRSTDSHTVPVDWSLLSQLRIVVVHVVVLHELPLIRAILEAAWQSPSRDTLEEIQVQIRSGIKQASDLELLRPRTDWERIDAAIAGLATCARFRSVTFLVRCTFVHLAEIGSSKVKARLPLSQAAGAVNFVFKESKGCGTAPGSKDRHRLEVMMSPRTTSSTHVWL
jgi:hypothetical protein